ncbi:hypothetical protein L218DRAFT_48660 [Marasmius fiardii PR-910]|nr:hypothetical protein L218DRAFT_48660 [Marasmius fiardii PR-910]
MPLVRCRNYTDEGQSIRAGCRNGTQCKFVHPESSDWERASKPNRMRNHSSSFGRNSDAERSNAPTNVDGRIASSTWPLPPSPYKKKVNQDRDRDSWASIIDSTCDPQDSDTRTGVNERNDSSRVSDNGWGGFKRDVRTQSSSDSIPWAAENGSWGDLRNNGWGDAPSALDKDIAAAWGVVDDDDSSSKGSEKTGSWGVKQPQVSTPSNSWGDEIPRKNGSWEEKQPQASSSNSWRKAGVGKTRPASPPMKPAPTRSSTSFERTIPSVPPISTSNVSKPSAFSPMEPSPATSLTPNNSHSNSPVIPQRAPSYTRVHFTNLSERLNSVPTLKAAGKVREASPVFSERSLSSATTDKQRSYYRRAIEKMITIALLKQQLEQSQRKLLRWKNIQKSEYFARLRAAGRRRMDNTRRVLTRDVQGVHSRIQRELKVLHDIPDMSVSIKMDIAHFNEQAAHYLTEVEEWLSDIQKRGEGEGKAKEQDGNDVEKVEEAEVSPMQQKWGELKERMGMLEEKLDDVIEDIQDFFNFDIKEQANAIAQNVLQAKVDQVQPKIQEQKEILLEVKVNLQSRQELLKSLQEKHQENLELKAEIEKRFTTLTTLAEERTARIQALRGEIINLHNLKPISHHEQLAPHIKDLVDTIVNEEVIPAFNALAVQCHAAAEQSHVLAARKIDEKLRPLETFANGIRAQAAHEANLVRGHH